MKLKNNLTREAILNMLIEQGYIEEQIIILLYSIEHNLGLEKYVTKDMSDEHMSILIEFLEDGRSIDDYFFNDGTLDIPTLELDDEIRTRRLLGYY
jgi:hypothetical protein